MIDPPGLFMSLSTEFAHFVPFLLLVFSRDTLPLSLFFQYFLTHSFNKHLFTINTALGFSMTKVKKTPDKIKQGGFSGHKWRSVMWATEPTSVSCHAAAGYPWTDPGPLTWFLFKSSKQS